MGAAELGGPARTFNGELADGLCPEHFDSKTMKHYIGAGDLHSFACLRCGISFKSDKEDGPNQCPKSAGGCGSTDWDTPRTAMGKNRHDH